MISPVPTGVPVRPAATYSRAYIGFFVVLLLIANTLSYADRHLFSVLIPAIKDEFKLSDGSIGLIGGPVFVVSFVLFSFPLATLADRYSHRGVLASSIALFSAATAWCGLAGNMLHLALARLLVGIGEAGGLPPAQAMLSVLVGERRRSSVMGVLSAGSYAGLVLGLAGGAAIAGMWGWRWAFFALAMPGLPIALLIRFTAPKNPQRAPSETKSSISMIAAFRICFATPSLRLLAIGMGTFNIFAYAAVLWLPAYFMRSHGMTMIEAGAWMGLGAASGGILGSLTSGVIVDALRTRSERWQVRLPALALLISAPLFAIGLLLPRGISIDVAGLHLPLVALINCLTTFFSALWAGPSFAAASRVVAPEMRAQATALLIIITNVLGPALGPVVAGLVSDAFSERFGVESIRYSLLVISLFTVIGGAIFWRAGHYYPADIKQ